MPNCWLYRAARFTHMLHCYTATPASSHIILHPPASTVNLVAFTGCCALVFFRNFGKFPQCRLQWPPHQLLGAWLWQLRTFQSQTNSPWRHHGRIWQACKLPLMQRIRCKNPGQRFEAAWAAESSESSESSVSKLSDLVV